MLVPESRFAIRPARSVQDAPIRPTPRALMTASLVASRAAIRRTQFVRPSMIRRCARRCCPLSAQDRMARIYARAFLHWPVIRPDATPARLVTSMRTATTTIPAMVWSSAARSSSAWRVRRPFARTTFRAPRIRVTRRPVRVNSLRSMVSATTDSPAMALKCAIRERTAIHSRAAPIRPTSFAMIRLLAPWIVATSPRARVRFCPRISSATTKTSAMAPRSAMLPPAAAQARRLRVATALLARPTRATR